MTGRIPKPEDCADMQDVRAGVDQTDRELVMLLARRFGYMRAAARIKTERGAVRDEVRKAAVINSVADKAAAAGLPRTEIADIWDRLVEASIAYEMVEWDRLRS